MRVMRRCPVPRQRGATLVEYVVVVPTLLFVMMNLIQYGLMYHAKGQLNYAAFEAARAGTVAHADPAAMRAAFARAMTGYYGGGRNTAELAQSHARALADLGALRIEILSPAKESFDDYASPELAARLKTKARAIPNANLAYLACPADRPGCAKDPNSNKSGQTLQDANLLKVRLTWGIPAAKQVPLAGRFMNWALGVLNPGDPDGFRQGLVAAGRLPVVAHVVLRMQSPAIESGNASLPGSGNGGQPTDPGPEPDRPGLPVCPITDPACTGGGDTEPTPSDGDGGAPCPDGSNFCPVCTDENGKVIKKP